MRVFTRTVKGEGLKMLQLAVIVCSFFLIMQCLLTENLELLAMVAIAILVNNILFCLQKTKERILLLFLNLMLFVFVLDRPFIDFLKGKNWISNAFIYNSNAKAVQAMILIIISLLGLFLGGILGEILKGKRKIKGKISKEYINILKQITCIVFLVSFFFDALMGLEKITFRMNHTYAEYYYLFQSILPYWVYIIASFNGYSLCLYLATKPTKKRATFFLILYILLSLPKLIVGSRGEFIVRILFALFYYIYRDYCQDKEIWIGKKEKYLLLFGSPFGIVFLGLFNYARDGGVNVNFSVFEIITDFFYKQGVTFSWISAGLGVMEELPAHINYSFGAVIDYILYGKFGQLVFETKEIAAGNNVMRASTGNSLSHHLSYRLLGNQYLQGHGTGSTYLLENYIDFGYVGVFFISVCLGMILIWIVRKARNSYLCTVLVFTMFPGIILMARGEFSDIFAFLFYLQFWLIFTCCTVGALLLKERFSMKKYQSY